MVKYALLFALLLGGCYDDRYQCADHPDCDIGVGGRCEVDHYCTQRDTDCSTLRRYAPHAGELSGECFDDHVEPLDPCASGQPPAPEEGACYTAVCGKLKACCEVAWVDACVQIAQETPACELRCDTRIAITASRNSAVPVERFDVRWSPSSDKWHYIQRSDLTALSWVAPAPGQHEPRLAGVTGETLVIGSTEITVPPGRTYRTISSIGLDRDRRDTVVASFVDSEGNKLELWKLDTLLAREQRSAAATVLVWGEADRDGYPDAVSTNGGPTFNFLYNAEDEQYQRLLFNQTVVMVNDEATPGAPQQVAALDWTDINSDGKLDLIMFGNEVRMHTNPMGLGDAASRIIDCDPPSRTRECSKDVNEPNLEAAAFIGCGVPTAAGPFVAMSMFPGRNLHFVQPDGIVVPQRLEDGCFCVKNQAAGTQCPGPTCKYSYNCNNCPPILALVARDLDGDHRLDLIAIDAKVRLYIARASTGFTWEGPTLVNPTYQGVFFSLDISVSGARE
jgi:hypothetical protein